MSQNCARTPAVSVWHELAELCSALAVLTAVCTLCAAPFQVSTGQYWVWLGQRLAVSTVLALLAWGCTRAARR